MVNKIIINFEDKPQVLRNKTLINIGNEQLYFYLPKTDFENKE